MKTFDEQIREMQNERHRNEWWQGQRRLAKGEDIWVRFVAWCYGEGHGEWKGDPKRFADYLKANGIELDFWRRKAIAENHFGYRFEWNGKEWKIAK